MADWTIEAAGPQAVIIRFGSNIDPQLTTQIRVAHDRLASQLNNAIQDLIPSYTTLMVVYDILQYDFAGISRAINETLQNLESRVAENKLIEIPVFYDSSVGFDLQRVADLHGISINEVIDRHSQAIYQVFAIGFAPGFAYMGNVADNLITPRLDSPRTQVPAGSVAIADQQTAVYPIDTPGGWNIIGRTFINMLDRELPALCPVQVGDKVRFIPISRAEFLAHGGKL